MHDLSTNLFRYQTDGLGRSRLKICLADAEQLHNLVQWYFSQQPAGHAAHAAASLGMIPPSGEDGLE